MLVPFQFLIDLKHVIGSQMFRRRLVRRLDSKSQSARPLLLPSESLVDADILLNRLFTVPMRRAITDPFTHCKFECVAYFGQRLFRANSP